MSNQQNPEVNPVVAAKQTLIDAMDIAVQKGCFNIHQCKEVIIALETVINQPDVQFGEVELKVEKADAKPAKK